MHDYLDDTNWLLYAAKNYDNAQCLDTVEFYEDLNKFKYIKRLLNRYVENGDLKERLILNHLVVIYNVFGNAATKMLFFKLKGHEQCLKPFLEFIGRLPERVTNIGVERRTIITSQIVSDSRIEEILREI